MCIDFIDKNIIPDTNLDVDQLDQLNCIKQRQIDRRYNAKNGPNGPRQYIDYGPKGHIYYIQYRTSEQLETNTT